MFSTSMASAASLLAKPAATRVGELARPAHTLQDRTAAGTADAFAAVQIDNIACVRRPPTAEITRAVLDVPLNVNDFDDDLKGQLDAIVDELDSLDVLGIQITGYASSSMMHNRGRKRAEAVELYFRGKAVDQGLMSTRGKSDNAQMVANEGVKIKIIGMPKEQASTDPAQPPRDRSTLSCIVRFTDGTSITTGPR